MLEGASENAALKPGNRVIWWKRIPGGDYVYPVQATVLALGAAYMPLLFSVAVSPTL